MTLTEKEQHLVKKVIKIALQEKSAKIQLPHELKWPENIPMIVDHWIKDKHSFKLDGLVLLGLCKVVGENVRVILKLADEANDRLKKPAVQPQDELFITVPDLVEVDVPLMIQRGLRFTAEISKITIPDAPPSDVWKDEVIWNLDEDLSPITDEMLKEMNEITSTYKISSENSASADFQESVFMFDDEDFSLFDHFELLGCCLHLLGENKGIKISRTAQQLHFHKLMTPVLKTPIQILQKFRDFRMETE